MPGRAVGAGAGVMNGLANGLSALALVGLAVVGCACMVPLQGY